MQVSEFTVIILFNAILDLAPDAFRPLLVEQNTAGGLPNKCGFWE